MELQYLEISNSGKGILKDFLLYVSRAMAALAAFGRPGLNRTPSASRPLYSFNMARSPPSDGSVSISNYYQFREKVSATY